MLDILQDNLDTIINFCYIVLLMKCDVMITNYTDIYFAV